MKISSKDLQSIYSNKNATEPVGSAEARSSHFHGHEMAVN